MTSANVSPPATPARQRLTQSAYRSAVSDAVIACQNGHTDQDMADLWGQSASTVKTARNRSNDLSAVPLLKLGERFGTDALRPVLALIGMKAVRIEATCFSPEQTAAVPVEIARMLPLLIQLLADGDCSDRDVQMLEREGVIRKLGEIVDMLERRSADLQIRSVA